MRGGFPHRGMATEQAARAGVKPLAGGSRCSRGVERHGFGCRLSVREQGLMLAQVLTEDRMSLRKSDWIERVPQAASEKAGTARSILSADSYRPGPHR